MTSGIPPRAVDLTSGVCVLSDLGVLAARGTDALRFLQGQLSSDTSRLIASGSQLTGLHNPQGRCVAVLRLVLAQPDVVLAVLPLELIAGVAERLRKYILRAKLRLTDESGDWQIIGLLGGAPRASGAILIPLGDRGDRMLSVRPHTATHERATADVSRERWRALDIEAGLPQIHGATSERFVAQMLNLDVLGGIAFDKGCYTGQEVIARAHYRGRVKRRLQRFATLAAGSMAPGSTTPRPFAPGFQSRLGDGRPFTVIEAVERADRRCEFLAVTALTAAGEDAEQMSPDGGESGELSRVDCEPLPLPYSLPS